MTQLYAFTFVLLSSLGAPLWSARAPQLTDQSPFVCNLGALTPEERAKLPGLLDRLLAASPRAKELPNGYELVFSKNDGLFTVASEWLTAEYRCCRFFDISIKVSRSNGPMTIRLTGPEGVKAFIAEDLPKLHSLLTAKPAKS